MKSLFSLLLSLLLISAAHSPVVYAGTADSKGPSLMTPIKTGSKYENWLPTPMFIEGGSMWSMAWKWIKGGEREKPKSEIPIAALDKKSFAAAPTEGLTVRWLGHSSVLVEISNHRILIDPVLSRYASPVPGITGRFSKSPVRLEDLPRIDAVVISHDHYDHLEKNTAIFLSNLGTTFFVPTGVGRVLRTWGIPHEQIRELTWWEESRLDALTFICVPARHFSGRGLFDRNETLWAGWVVKSRAKSLYYSGDTGYANHFASIGEKYGPFDLTMIKIGAYGVEWPDIHVNPEQAIKANTELRGKILMPVHWATFALALHPWDEPITRLVKAAKQSGVGIITPMIGELVNIDKPGMNRSWWEEVQ